MSETPKEPSEQPQENKQNLSYKELDRTGIDQDIVEEVEPILEKLPSEEKKTILRAFGMSVKRWSGPLPEPGTLKGYNECFDGGAKAVFDMAKAQSEHRMSLETMAVNRELDQSGRGQNYAFILSLILMLSAVFLAYIGQGTVAAIFIGIDIIGLAAVFIAGKHGIKMDLRQKKKKDPSKGDLTPPVASEKIKNEND